MQKQGVKIDYVDIVDAKTLQPLQMLHGRVLIAVAIFLGKTRLIDNLLLDLNKSPKPI
jgi:pantoate--beta-alanine ligase